MEGKDKCEICGAELMYALNQNEILNLKCEICEQDFDANTYCINKHYICDNCHSKDPNSVIEDICLSTKIKNPFHLADLIMKHPKFKLYGPEHHVLTPAVILITLRNNNVKKPTGEEITVFEIKEAIRRASKIPGGWCGFYGSCGAGMGSGVAISVFTGATPGKDIPRSMANRMTSRSLSRIADNLEHCCKRSVKISICEALNFFKEEFGIYLNYEPSSCSFSSVNNKCEHEKCLMFQS